MTAACSPLPLILACQDDPFKRNAAQCGSASPGVCTERWLETMVFEEPVAKQCSGLPPPLLADTHC
jgi:hypothetical protein